MKKLLLPVFIVVASVVAVSCSKDEGVTDNPNTVTLAKHWFVSVNGPSGSSDYSLFSTRTAYVVELVDTFGNQGQRQLKDTLTIDDHNMLSPSIRAHFQVNPDARTFGAGLYHNWNGSDSVILKEGKIIRNGGRSRTGVTVDSIYLKYAFKSTPAIEYVLHGHERTGLLQDEY